MGGRRGFQFASFGLSSNYSHNSAVIIATFRRATALALLSASFLPARELTIVALGDSTTAGTPAFRSPLEVPPEGDGDPQSQYTYWMTKKHPEWTVYNHGIAGQRTDGLRDRLDAALALRPQYLIVLGGINDIVQGVDPAMTTRNLGGMYREIKRRGIIPIAASLLPFDQATARQNAEIERLNNWIKDAAEKLHIPFVDLHPIVADPNNPNVLNGSTDGLHPDVGGYRQIGNALVRELEHLEELRPIRK
jgi:lysophospholipase L1-like esterase